MTRAVVVALLVFVTAVTAALPPSPAFADGELTVRIEAVDDSAGSGGGGSAAVTVLGTDGRPVLGLTNTDFAVTDDGKPVSVRSVVRAEDASVGIAVVLAIDTSLSMQPVIEAARTGAGGVLDGLAPDDRAAIISFADGVVIVRPLTDDAAALDDGLDSLVADGPTALHDAVLEAVAIAGGAPLDRRVVILLTDGLDDGSTASRGDALAAAATSGVPIYALGFGAETDEELLRDLATASDGSVLLAPDAAAMLAAYEAFASVLRSQYIVEFEPAPAGTEAARQLEVTVTAAGVSAAAVRSYTSGRSTVALAAPPAQPAVETAPLPVAPLSTVTAPPAATAPDTSGPGALFTLGAVIAAMFAMALGALVVVRRQRQVAATPALLGGTSRSVQAAAPTSGASASLFPIEATTDDEFVISEGDLLLLGDEQGCGTATDAVYRTGPARLWWRDGKLMLHRRPVFGHQSEPSWATLETGDVIEVGSDRFRVEITPATTESRN